MVARQRTRQSKGKRANPPPKQTGGDTNIPASAYVNPLYNTQDKQIVVAPAATESAVVAPAAPESVEKKKATVKEMFMTLYGILMLIIIAVFVVLFLTSFFDIILFFYRESSQASQLAIDKRVFIDDTNDYDIMQYPQMSTEDEPYNVYLQQKMITYVFTMIAIFITVVGGHLFMHFLLYLLNKMAIVEYEEPAGFDDKKFYVIGGVIALVMAGCVALNSLYKHFFLKKVEPSMLHIRSQMQKIRFHFINNTPVYNDPFWAALKSGDSEMIINNIATSLANVSPSTTSTNIKHDAAAKKVMDMLYACNVYNNLVNTIPESDPMWYRFDNLFSSETKEEENDINLLLYYDNIPVMDTGTYAVLKGMDLEAIYNAMKPANAHTLTSLEEILPMNAVPAITDLNVLLNGMRDIKGNKRTFAKYIYGFFAIALFFIAILGGGASKVINQNDISFASLKTYVKSKFQSGNPPK